MANYLYFTATTAVNIRADHSSTSASHGVMTRGSSFRAKDKGDKPSDIWYEQTISEMGRKVTYTWIQGADGKWRAYDKRNTSGGVISGPYFTFSVSSLIVPTAGTQAVQTVQEQTNTVAEAIEEEEEQTRTGIIEVSSGYTPDVATLLNFDTDYELDLDTSTFNIRSVLGIFGLPYQFLPHADPRIGNNINETSINSSEYYGDTLGIGELYAEKIIEDMPILFMSPGKPNFMTNYNNESKQTVLEFIIKNAANLANNLSIDDVLTGKGRYYTFEYDVPGYYQYVNPMCRIAAAYMEVATYTLDGIMLGSLNWQNYTLSKISGIFNGGTVTDYLSIPFYIESETQISDSFGNDVGESSIASTINGISDQARELSFITGNLQSAANINIIMQDQDIASNAENISAAIKNIMGNKTNFLGNLGNHLVSVASGGKMMFPKIWTGSDFSRSYDITIKLRSPDMDNLSLYFNIVVPTMHMIGFVAPHVLNDDPNAYGNPFVVRAIYKGFFNIDIGMITNLSITKGDTAMWNANGIPSTLDISFTITDLYNIMAITPTKATAIKYDTLDNTSQMDYIANFCGINIYKPEIGRTIYMWFINNFVNRVGDFVSTNIWGSIRNSVAASIVNIFHNPG